MAAGMIRVTKEDLIKILNEKYEDKQFVGYIFAASKGYNEHENNVLVFFDEVVEL